MVLSTRKGLIIFPNGFQMIKRLLVSSQAELVDPCHVGAAFLLKLCLQLFTFQTLTFFILQSSYQSCPASCPGLLRLHWTGRIKGNAFCVTFLK